MEIMFIVSDNCFLVVGQLEQCWLLFGWHVLVFVQLLCDFLLQVGQQDVLRISHFLFSDSIKCWFKTSLLECFTILVPSFIKSVQSKLAQKTTEIVVLIPSDSLQHVYSPIMEVLLKVLSWVSQVVHEWSLLNKLVLIVNSHIVQLFLSVLEPLILRLLTQVLPLVDQLWQLVPWELIVECCELWTRDPVEVLDFYVANEEGDDEFWLEQETFEPLILLPSSQVGHTHDSADVEEEEDDRSSWPAQTFVVGRHLLRASSFAEQIPDLVRAWEQERMLLGVIRMLISLLQPVDVWLIVASAILSGVLSLWNSDYLVLLWDFPCILESLLNAASSREGSDGWSKYVASESCVSEACEHLYNNYNSNLIWQRLVLINYLESAGWKTTRLETFPCMRILQIKHCPWMS